MKILNTLMFSRYMVLPLACALLLVACDHSNKETEISDQNDGNDKMKTGLDISLFKAGAFIKEPEIVDCETNVGTKTTCFKLVTSGGPAGREPGDFCPRNITDGADVSGGWFSKDGAGELVDLTGEFIANLASYYDDPNWKLYNPETGKVRYTASTEASFGAAEVPNEAKFFRKLNIFSLVRCFSAKIEQTSKNH